MAINANKTKKTKNKTKTKTKTIVVIKKESLVNTKANQLILFFIFVKQVN